MMENNLKKRILTSFVLIFFFSISLFFNKYLLLFFLFLVILICYIEFNNLLLKICENNFLGLLFTRFIIFNYLVFFAYASYQFYNDYLLLLIVICVFSDTGGFIVGKSLGGKKLTRISPNKTISGSIGSFIFSNFPFIYFFYFDQTKLNIGIIFTNDKFINFFIFSFLSSLLCQLGDLSVSYLKRKANIKDTGKILPGHGGLLDRIDGIIFVIPFLYLLNLIML